MSQIELETVIFNFHDAILLMTAMQCLFFGSLLFITNEIKLKSTYFLAAFLFSHALIPINELVMWGAEFKHVVRAAWPEIYFIPNLAYFIDGQLLFLCIKSLVFRDFSLRKSDLLHLVPLVAYAVFIGAAFYSHSSGQRLEMIKNEKFVYSSAYVGMEFLIKWLRVFYTVTCLFLIIRYRNLLKDTHSSLEKVHITWLISLVGGFLVVMLSETVLVGAKIMNLFEHNGFSVFMTLGLTGNYLSFVLVNLLVFTAIRHFWIFEQVVEVAPVRKAMDECFVNPEMAVDVDNAIRGNKTYIDPDITLDTLAESLNIMPRDLSMLINRNFGVNFYEFINQYRIDEAKRMLISPEYKNTTITDIYQAVGFNSKSVFYTFFKKIEGITPSQFRRSAGD